MAAMHKMLAQLLQVGPWRNTIIRQAPETYCAE